MIRFNVNDPVSNGRHADDASAVAPAAGYSAASRAAASRAAGHFRAKTSLRELGRFVLVHRVWLLALGHGIVFSVSFWVAFGLRFDFAIPWDMYDRLGVGLPAVLSTKMLIFYFLGHFHGWWRYVTFADLKSLLRASLWSLLVVVLVSHYALPDQLPRSVVVVDCLLTVLLLGSMRSSFRLFHESTFLRTDPRRATLMLGTDHSSAILAHQIHATPGLPYRVIGFVTNNTQRVGSRLGDIPILGTLDDAGHLALVHDAEVILVVAGAVTGKQLRELMEQSDERDIEVKIIPPASEAFNGNGKFPVRDIEINDLLRREPVELDSATIFEKVAGKTVMVTGAGGSIGSEISRQLFHFKPTHLVLVDCGENSLFLLDNELAPTVGDTELHVCVGDVRDVNRMRMLFEQHRPHLVIHAAAHKHVGVVEKNIGEAVKTNVFGTKYVADLAAEYGSERFVLISTDKAVNPTSVMGVTKQIAERYIHSLAQESQTAFLVVRFGNVLASNGSVVPIFQEQIRRGGPITVTDPRMTRFFMTIPEASQLVLQAGSMGEGGEIFVLEMGEQVRIVDLARDLILLSGLPVDAIEIVYTGARPGEKLFEELYFDDEESLETSHSKLRAVYHRPYPVDEVRESIGQLFSAINGTNKELRNKLKVLVPEYQHTPATHVVPLPVNMASVDKALAD